MIYLLLLGLLPAIYAGSSSSICYKYNVKVMYARDLPDEDPDAPTIFGWQAWVNKNDPYVQVFAYGTGGDDKLKVETTTIKEGTETPEWNEEFEFLDGDSNGPYDHFLFKLWDDDATFDEDGYMDWLNVNDPDYLGETKEVKVSEISDTKDYFEMSLEVTRDGKGCGILVVEFSKDVVSCGDDKDANTYDNDDDKDDDKDANTYDNNDKEDEDDKGDDKDNTYDDDDDKAEEEETKGKGSGGGGKTKRRLLNQ